MKTVKITLIAMATVFAGCTSLLESKKEIAITNKMTYKNLDSEVKVNEVNVINLKLDNFTTSFRVAYTKNGVEPNCNFNISMTNNMVYNQFAPIVFSGNSEFVKKYSEDQEVDEKAFQQTGNVFLKAKSFTNYNTTLVNSFPFDESNFAIFKIVHKNTQKEYYGWINFTITTDKIIFHKMSYSTEKLTSITDEEILAIQ